MALKLYRRHRKECEGGHPEDARTGEFEEGRRGWKTLRLHHHVAGTLGKKIQPASKPARRDWEESQGPSPMHGKRPAHGTAKSLRLREPLPEPASLTE